MGGSERSERMTKHIKTGFRMLAWHNKAWKHDASMGKYAGEQAERTLLDTMIEDKKAGWKRERRPGKQRSPARWKRRLPGGKCYASMQNSHQRGPDIPCFLKIEKWIITKIRVSSGKTNV